MYGVSVEKNESSRKVLALVEKIVNEICPKTFEFGSPVDLAHRTGKKEKADGVVIQPIIFRFLTFRSRTAVYRKN